MDTKWCMPLIIGVHECLICYSLYRGEGAWKDDGFSMWDLESVSGTWSCDKMWDLEGVKHTN